MHISKKVSCKIFIDLHLELTGKSLVAKFTALRVARVVTFHQMPGTNGLFFITFFPAHRANILPHRNLNYQTKKDNP